jgi:GT2 family glycosyltransferase
MPLLSLVTGTYNRPRSLNRLIRSIQENSKVDWELLIADADGKAFPWHQPEKIWVISDGDDPDHPTPMGHTKSYNRCFHMCRGKWVIWLNDDAEVEPGYDENAIRFMETHRVIGLGCLYYREQRPNGFTNYHINNYRGMLYANFGILSKNWGDQIGWFDEDFPMYGADNSLAFRTLLAGRGIAGISNARLVHHSEQDEVRQENQHYRSVASKLFQTKYQPQFDLMMHRFKKFALPEDQPKVPTHRPVRTERRPS